ncbi:phosphonate C-P lyase system protein PhnL [Desulfoluna spongiiphila]|uniref:Methylphosphonate degradation complex, subunit phnL n=1 Tax=Desulfoluna spongiiphila TaxID=419481 RepID=A0A1G5DXR8_9BACT|nr:phosphonate C-P lyase system protein PhnL [Desulfoluna spongiiphila]SCY19546.1 methylphosphonate degradation complex, subunit phnL [Desulfoluna spongiiphila]
MEWVVNIEKIRKNFCLHTQGNVTIPVLDEVNLTLAPGEAVVLVGPSGAGKSTLLKLIYGNYRMETGRVWVRHGERSVEMGGLSPMEVIDVRNKTIGYVSQFLRVIPRVSALDVVMEPMLGRGVPADLAGQRAKTLLERLRIPERLWDLSPTTFSGGEQQRINIARGFAVPYPVMLLDEPTASLDPDNTQTVCDLMEEARQSGTAFLGIFHDEGVRQQVATRSLPMAPGSQMLRPFVPQERHIC